MQTLFTGLNIYGVKAAASFELVITILAVGELLLFAGVTFPHLETGYWNCCDRVSAALPWSGRNHSGFGVTLSHAGLRAFTKPKAYHLKG